MKALWEGKISAVTKYSVADAAGIQAGEFLCAINGMPLRDILEVSFAAAESELTLCIRGRDRKLRNVSLEKGIDVDDATCGLLQKLVDEFSLPSISWD